VSRHDRARHRRGRGVRRLDLGHVLSGSSYPSSSPFSARSRRPSSRCRSCAWCACLYPGLGYSILIASRAPAHPAAFDASARRAFRGEILAFSRPTWRESAGEQKREFLLRVMRFSHAPRNGDDRVWTWLRCRSTRPARRPSSSCDSSSIRGSAHPRRFARRRRRYLYVTLAFNATPRPSRNLEPVRREPSSSRNRRTLRRPHTMQKTHTPFAVVVDEYGGRAAS